MEFTGDADEQNKMEPASITTAGLGILAFAVFKTRSIVHFLLRCHHRHLSRPLAPVRKRGVPQGQNYVVCLDCGTHLAYDTTAWQVGRPLPTSG